MFPGEPHAVTDLPLELIERRLAELAAQINAGSCRWLELLAEFDRRCGWANTGCLSTADWVAWRCAVSPRAAREHVRIARCLAELPLLHAAFSRGELSYSMLRPLTRVAARESEADLLELARHATAAQLERVLGRFRHVSSEEARDANERAFVAYDWEEDGSLTIRARLAPHEGAAFLRAMEAARDSIWAERFGDGSPEPQDVQVDDDSDEDLDRARDEGTTESERGSAEPRAAWEPRPHRAPPVTNAEAFSALVETARARGPTSTSGGERYLVNVHVDAASLAGGDGRCHLDDGPALAPQAARKLACDAQLVRVVEADGEVLSVGRKTRSIPPALRRALLTRDGQCRFPGCERRRFLDAHHVVHWADGGETSLRNTLLLCRSHHDLLHEGGFTIRPGPDGELRFRSPYGFILESSPALGRASAERLSEDNRARGLEIGADTCLAGSGERVDLAACVDAVVTAAGVVG
jgi:uncharacterized protein DUF222/HNH endonuclease